MSASWPPGPVWVVVPTYNEAGNIARLVTELLAIFDSAGFEGRLLIVDDGSPDGTGAIVRDHAARDARVRLLERQAKQGIGPAYLAGFAVALAEGAELVVQMDADFSHDPKDVPRLVAAARDADLVLGSRYVRGGGVARWNRLRRLISRGGSAYARTVLGVGIRDLTGGFKCFRRAVLERLDLTQVGAAGYVFQIEMTYRAILAGFRVAEIPIIFTERIVGVSKMSGSIVREAAVRVPRLRRLRDS